MSAIIKKSDGRFAMATGSESAIMQDAEILSGEPVFRGTRVPFQNLLDYLEGGETLDEFLKQFPGVTREQAIAALEEAKSLVRRAGPDSADQLRSLKLQKLRRDILEGLDSGSSAMFDPQEIKRIAREKRSTKSAK